MFWQCIEVLRQNLFTCLHCQLQLENFNHLKKKKILLNI